ncbi:MAG TPA: Slp family lipoprotein [Methylophaga aminisulfidivorans]|uniref:Slp family lipoprotein n=2 Tax=root TaxID=1 RepID=A0A7C1W6T4_9GAMM|nr:Slp family lipoprotein [Methylophaga aminisulfidivorans]
MRVFFVFFVLCLSACSNLPMAIKDAPKPDLMLSQVSNAASQYQGQSVRWGGQVITVDNDEAGAIVQIAQFPLNTFGRPNTNADSEGRFIISSKSFIDPYVYKKGTMITVAGQVSGTQNVTVDKANLSLPVVNMSELYRWTPSDYEKEPYWKRYPYYDPFFDRPYYPPGWGPSWRYNNRLYW